MQKFIKFFFLLVVLLKIEIIDSQEVDDSPTHNNEFVIFSSDEKRCPMYTDDCYVSFAAYKKLGEIKLDMLKSTNERTFKIESVKLCDSINEKSHEIEVGCHSFDDLKKNISMKDYSIYSIKIKPGIVGFDHILFVESKPELKTVQYLIAISEPRRLIDIIFDYYIKVFQIAISLLMGILLDYKALLKLVKIPIPVMIGLCSQYIIMPLVAFSFVKIVGLNNMESLAIFIYGCSPGGSSSNNWTIIFNGDIDLSVLMTFCSTISSLFMLPLWLYTLGRVFTEKANITIPFLKLLPNLLITIIPCLLGLFLALCFPKIKTFGLKIAKGFTLFAVFTLLSALFYLKFYVFTLINIKSWFGFLIPWLGFALGAFAAFISRLPKNQVITISIETGMQNFGVAFLIIMFNLPSPEKDYAALPLMAIAILTPLPFYLILLFKLKVKIIKKCIKLCSKSKLDNDNDATKDVEEGEKILAIEIPNADNKLKETDKE